MTIITRDHLKFTRNNREKKNNLRHFFESHHVNYSFQTFFLKSEPLSRVLTLSYTVTVFENPRGTSGAQ